MFFFFDLFIDWLGFKRAFDAGKVFLVFNIWFSDLDELFFWWFIELIFSGVEKIAIGFIFLHDVEGHLQIGKLKFDDKIDEHFIFWLGYSKIFTFFPKLFSHPVCNNSHILQVIHKTLHISYLLTKQTTQPQLTPGSSFFVFVNQCERYYFA